MKTNVATDRSDAKDTSTDWMATFTILDASGSITASQWRRVSAPVISAWRRLLGKRVAAQ